MSAMFVSPAATFSGLSPEKCQQRNRISALRYEVNTAPIMLARSLDRKPEVARGKVPSDPDEALSLINKLLPNGAAPLTMDDIYLLPMESANSSFVGDRYMFLGSSTLKNVSRDAEAGFAFMNSHRTGAMSTPSELPLGRTYAGRYERYPAEGKNPAFERVVLGVYMLKGVYPNGQSGPSTDTIYQMVKGGTLFDVSMGINGGTRICDICGHELRSDECNHMPGTSHNVNKEQAAIQTARGVRKGRASYTLEDGHGGEVSGVYDGAVPGAGFSKTYHAFQSGALTRSEIAEMREAYGALLSKGDFNMEEEISQAAEQISDSVFNKVKKLFTGGVVGNPTANASAELPTLTLTTTGTAAGTASIPWNGSSNYYTGTVYTPLAPSEEQLALQKERDEALARVAALEAENRAKEAEALANEMIEDKHLLPAGREALIALAATLSEDDETDGFIVEYKTNLGQTKRGSRMDLLRSVLSDTPQHDLLTDHELTDLPDDAVMLKSSNDEKVSEYQKGIEFGKKWSERNSPPSTNGNGNGHSK